MESSYAAAHCSKKEAPRVTKFLQGLANTLIFKTLYFVKSTLNGGGENGDASSNSYWRSYSSLGTSE
jgi:hypothetical protein